LGLRIETREDVIKAGRKLVDTIQSKTVLITLGEEGMALFEGEKEPAFIPTRAQQVHDVSGAGDTVIATLGVACSAGADFSEAATIANHAAGIVCGEVGIVSVDRERLYRDLIREAEEETKGRTAGGGE